MANIKANALSDLGLKALKKPEVKKWVRDGNGLALCLTPATSGPWRHWYFIYISPETKRKCYYKIGSYPEIALSTAREKAGDFKTDTRKGIDPLAKERRASETRRAADEQKRLDEEAAAKVVTVAELAADYLERHAKVKKRSWQKDEAILNKDVILAWGKRKAKDIVKRDVVLLLEKIVDRGAPIMANNTFAVIRKMFNYAVEKDILLTTPCLGAKAPSDRKSSERTLSEIEIKTIWESLDRTDLKMSGEIKRALKLVLVTAQRPGEVIGLHTREIDGHWWTLPAERSKNGREHRVYLTDRALELIGDTTGKGYIFKTPLTNQDKPIGETALPIAVMRNLNYPMTDAKGKPLYRKDGKPATENRLGVEKVVPHDMRRTGATFMSEMGFMDEVIDSVLNHKKKGIIATYNKNKYDKEKQQALEAWERKLNSIITKKENNVIPLTRKVA